MQGIIKELLTKNAPKHVHQIEGHLRGWNVAESLVTKFQVSTFNSLFINGEKSRYEKKITFPSSWRDETITACAGHVGERHIQFSSLQLKRFIFGEFFNVFI